jgi:flagellar hook assembly protein FlgD
VIRTLVTGLEGHTALPTTFAISQNYPNPFNPTTSIKYQLPQTSDVRLLIYNVLGQKVRTLVNNQIEAGYHSVIWDGRNDEGNAVASGVYIYRFEAGKFTRTMKLMLLK